MFRLVLRRTYTATRATLRGAALTGLCLTAGCGSQSSSPTSPSSQVVTADVRAALERSIQTEYRAETMYQGVVNDLGAGAPFSTVLQAELRHSAAIAQLFARFGIAVPASGWTLSNVPRFDNLSVACGAAAVAEAETIAMYDELLRLDLPSDVRQVFSNNRLAALQNHLPAFEGCAGSR